MASYLVQFVYEITVDDARNEYEAVQLATTELVDVPPQEIKDCLRAYEAEPVERVEDDE